MRHASTIAATAAAVCLVGLLGACGGSEDDDSGLPELTAGSSSSSTSSPTTNTDGFTPEQQAVLDAATAYVDVAYEFGRGDADEAALAEVATPFAVNGVKEGSTSSSQGGTLEPVGKAVLTATEITVDGDAADLVGCYDGSASGYGPKGTDTLSKVDGRLAMTWTLAKEGSGPWKVAKPLFTGEPC